ncbi:MAG: ribonuclease H-like domain-containing protein [Planctomycetota bacterium]
MTSQRQSLRRRLERVRQALRGDALRTEAPHASGGSSTVDARTLDVDEVLHPAEVTADHFAPGFAGFVAAAGVSGARLASAESARLGGDSDALYFDLETTGLGLRARIFLTGCLCWEGGGLRLQQEFATDLAQEREVLSRLRERMVRRPRLITYNGRSFDVPLLRRRLAFHSLEPLPPELVVEDLLHRTRRAHGKGLPNCRLSTVERLLIGKLREGKDICGAEAPLRFQDFLATGRRELLDPIVYHNRIDLTTLVALRWLLDRDAEDKSPTQDSLGMDS